MILFFILMWLAVLIFGVWAHFETAQPEKDYKIALCDRWHDGRWYFHDDAHDDYMESVN